MAQAHKTGKILDPATIVEYLCSHAISLTLVYAASRSTSSYATRVLSSMLEIIESIMKVGSSSRRAGIVDMAEDKS
jgi:hypothetical protein